MDYVRVYRRVNGHRRGLVTCNYDGYSYRLGWSNCSDRDNFNRDLAVNIATRRMESGYYHIPERILNNPHCSDNIPDVAHMLHSSNGRIKIGTTFQSLTLDTAERTAIQLVPRVLQREAALAVYQATKRYERLNRKTLV